MHTIRFRVRTYECDAYGHVNNAVYLNYLEYARDQYIEAHGLDYQSLVASGSGIFVAEAKLSYLSPALPGEELALTTEPCEWGAAFLVLGQKLWGPGERAVLGAHMKLVWVGPAGRPTRIPALWRQSLSTEA